MTDRPIDNPTFYPCERGSNHCLDQNCGCIDNEYYRRLDAMARVQGGDISTEQIIANKDKLVNMRKGEFEKWITTNLPESSRKRWVGRYIPRLVTLGLILYAIALLSFS